AETVDADLLDAGRFAVETANLLETLVAVLLLPFDLERVVVLDGENLENLPVRHEIRQLFLRDIMKLHCGRENHVSCHFVAPSLRFRVLCTTSVYYLCVC